MNVLSLCGPESGIPKNPSVRLLSYSKASDKVSVNSVFKICCDYYLCYFLVSFYFDWFEFCLKIIHILILILTCLQQEFLSLLSLQVVFSSSEDLDSTDQQTSLIPTVEEVVREEELQGEDLGSEQQFGVFKDFDFLDVELEDAEVRIYVQLDTQIYTIAQIHSHKFTDRQTDRLPPSLIHTPPHTHRNTFTHTE